MFDDTIVLATSWLSQDKLGQRPARTLLVGAAVLTVRQRFRDWSFDLQVDSTTVTDNPCDTMLWLSERLLAPSRLLLWRGEDIVVPSLIAAAESTPDTVTAAKLLRQLDRAFVGDINDVAAAHGGARATSFDAVAHRHGLPFVPLSQAELAEAHRSMCHGAIRDHLAARVKAMWRLWLQDQPDTEALSAATATWIAEQDAEARA